jgi:hypothetical protein
MEHTIPVETYRKTIQSFMTTHIMADRYLPTNVKLDAGTTKITIEVGMLLQWNDGQIIQSWNLHEALKKWFCPFSHLAAFLLTIP